MNKKFYLAAFSFALVLFLGSAHLRAATATFPTPADTNGNGTIDSSEIQDVVDMVTGVVFLPANKTYHIDVPIEIDTRNGVSLVGEGPSTVLTIAGNIEAVVITNGTGCGLRHLKLVGPAAHAQNAVRISGGNEHFLEDITIENTYRGVELVNGIGPGLVNITMTGLTGDYGIKVDAVTGKVDAAQLHGISGSASASSVEWLIFGRVDGIELQSANLSGGKRGIRCTGTTGPKYVYTNQVTITNSANEGILVESGSDLLVNATTINQTGSSGFTIGSGFVGGAVITDLNVSGAAGHGVQIDGGRDIGILEPAISATGSALPANTGAGIYIAASCLYVSVTDGFVSGQHYGVFYAGTEAQSDSQDVKIKDVYTAGNPVPFLPGNLVTPASATPAPTNIIVDNADTTGVTITGAWSVSGATLGYYSSNYLTDGNTGTTVGKSVRFTPNLPITTGYDVYLRWTSGPNRATNVPVDITHAGGTTTVTVNQRVDNGTWVLLGTFNFSAGTAGNVLVRNNGANGFVVADAVQFVRPVQSASIMLSNLNQTYDGTPKTVTTATSPNGLIVNLTYNGSSTPPVLPGLYAVGATLADPNYTGSTSATLAIRDVQPPVLALPANLQLEATSSAGAVATFTAAATDNVDGAVPVSFSRASGSTFPIGPTTVTATAVDAVGNATSGTFTVTVTDTTAPIFSQLTASPDVLYPADHELMPVTITAVLSDIVDAAPAAHIVSVSSNESSNGTGDGNTATDWQLTGDLTLNVRAERAGDGSGRIYTITVEAADHSGNSRQQTVSVTVPHSR